MAETYPFPARIITGGGPYLALSNETTFLCNHGAALQINLPITSPGKMYQVVDISNNALVNNITLSGINCNINGALTSVINVNRSMITVWSDGANYYKATSIL